MTTAASAVDPNPDEPEAFHVLKALPVLVSPSEPSLPDQTVRRLRADLEFLLHGGDRPDFGGVVDDPDLLSVLLSFYDQHEILIRQNERERLAMALHADADRYSKGAFVDGIRHAADNLINPSFAPFDLDTDLDTDLEASAVQETTFGESQ